MKALGCICSRYVAPVTMAKRLLSRRLMSFGMNMLDPRAASTLGCRNPCIPGKCDARVEGGVKYGPLQVVRRVIASTPHLGKSVFNVSGSSAAYTLSEHANEQKRRAVLKTYMLYAVLVPTLMSIVCAPTGSSWGRHQFQV